MKKQLPSPLANRADAIQKLDRLLWKLSWKAWRRLPPRLQSWIEPEDFYQEARLEAFLAYDSWDPERGAFITLAYRSVQNRLNSLLGFWTCGKRFANIYVDVEAIDKESEQAVGQFEPLIDSVIQMLAETIKPPSDRVLQEFGY